MNDESDMQDLRHASLVWIYGGDDETAQIDDGLVEIFDVAYDPGGISSGAGGHGQAACSSSGVVD